MTSPSGEMAAGSRSTGTKRKHHQLEQATNATDDPFNSQAGPSTIASTSASASASASASTSNSDDERPPRQRTRHTQDDDSDLTNLSFEDSFLNSFGDASMSVAMGNETDLSHRCRAQSSMILDSLIQAEEEEQIRRQSTHSATPPPSSQLAPAPPQSQNDEEKAFRMHPPTAQTTGTCTPSDAPNGAVSAMFVDPTDLFSQYIYSSEMTPSSSQQTMDFDPASLYPASSIPETQADNTDLEPSPYPTQSTVPPPSSQSTFLPPSQQTVIDESTPAPSQEEAPLPVEESAATKADPAPRPTVIRRHLTVPKVIPLHGTLDTMHCPKCTHTESIEPHLPTLETGHTIHCPLCLSSHHSRSALGERSRGIGVMKVSVVLYGEEHAQAGRVGEIAEKDLLKAARPDYLIVAGTTLKIPGVKKLVKELSKVVKAEKVTKNPSAVAVTGGGEVEETNSVKQEVKDEEKTKKEYDGDDVLDVPASSQISTASSMAACTADMPLPASQLLASSQSQSQPQSSAASNPVEAPTKVIYVNFDAPTPETVWSKVFDTFVQGDVQAFASLVRQELESLTSSKKSAGSSSAAATASTAVPVPTSTQPSSIAPSLLSSLASTGTSTPANEHVGFGVPHDHPLTDVKVEEAMEHKDVHVAKPQSPKKKPTSPAKPKAKAETQSTLGFKSVKRVKAAAGTKGGKKAKAKLLPMATPPSSLPISSAQSPLATVESLPSTTTAAAAADADVSSLSAPRAPRPPKEKCRPGWKGWALAIESEVRPKFADFWEVKVDGPRRRRGATTAVAANAPAPAPVPVSFTAGAPAAVYPGTDPVAAPTDSTHAATTSDADANLQMPHTTWSVPTQLPLLASDVSTVSEDLPPPMKTEHTSEQTIHVPDSQSTIEIVDSSSSQSLPTVESFVHVSEQKDLRGLCESRPGDTSSYSLVVEDSEILLPEAFNDTSFNTPSFHHHHHSLPHPIYHSDSDLSDVSEPSMPDTEPFSLCSEDSRSLMRTLPSFAQYASGISSVSDSTSGSSSSHSGSDDERQPCSAHPFGRPTKKARRNSGAGDGDQPTASMPRTKPRNLIKHSSSRSALFTGRRKIAGQTMAEECL